MMLKSLIFLLFGVLLFAPSAIAQKHTIGLQGGMVSSGMSMDYKGSADPMDKAPHFNRITNLYFSVSYGYNFFGKFHANTGIEFYNKGSIMRFDTGYADITGSGTYEYKTNTRDILTYLSIPLSISRQIHLDKNGKHRVLLCAGLNISYLLKATAEGYSVIEHTPAGSPKPEPSKVQEIHPLRMTGYFEWDFSVHIGGGYRFQINDDLGIGIDYRFLSNFNDINEERLRYELYDYKSSKYYRYSPKMVNQDNHVLSVGIFMSPRLFVGL
ncbi:MAG TPA: hypothetical protein DIW47_11405 [Bacteroidetes bacterium]|nr:hypothetical protein [Bacteroidota bacterium]